MDIFGIGIQEIIFILMIALIILGPRDMVNTSKKIGAWLRQFTMSDEWRVMKQTGDEIRNLPNTLMREANPDLDKSMDEVNKTIFGDGYGTWSRKTPIPTTGLPAKNENTIAPPQADAPLAQESPAESNKENHEENI